MSKGIVLELQQELINPEIRIYDILLKALLIAKKLELKDIKDWINSELEGYKGKEVPKYRILKGYPEYRNYWRGYWETLQVNAKDKENYQKIIDIFSTAPIQNSISEIEEWLKSEEEFIYLVYPPEILFNLQKGTQSYGEVEFRLSVPKSQVRNIIDQVRKKLLEWTLELERKGVVGENLSFTRDEKTKAEKLQQTFITNVYGSSNINISQISSEQGNIEQQNKLEIDNLSLIEQELKRILNELPSETKKTLGKEIEKLEKEKKNSEPKLERIKNTLLNIKDILQSSESIASISGKVIEYIDKFL